MSFHEDDIKDMIEKDFDKIERYAKTLGISISEDNKTPNCNGTTALNITHNCRSYRIEYNGIKFLLLHMDIRTNGRGKQRFHFEENSYTFHSLIRIISTSHNWDSRVKTSKNYKSIRQEKLFDKVSQEMKSKNKKKKKSKNKK